VVALIPASGKAVIRSTLAGADGSFHFPAIPPGDYELLDGAMSRATIWKTRIF
jgi:hypothetical protein